ncbi:MAG: TonB-dependent receptor plug domain-containing protein [Bacteroidetes bacterium]|nr:TonB-dependent receptor plug domain-containing protein [Bacteroidota bacterium]
MATKPSLSFACGFFLTATIILAASPHAFCQEDSTKVSRERLVSPVFQSGTITHEPSYTLSDSEITWNDYRYSGDLLQQIPGSFLANMYQPGNPSELYFDGLGGDYTKYLLDGVELNEPTTSSMNLYHVPMEFVRNVQYIDALRAPIYQFNATGGLVNFQTHLYSEAVPYSKVRHMEEPYNYLITDGVFSQNIGFNSNIDAGFERQTTDGRFDNSVYDGVNIRAKYRYSIDSTRQLTATEVYYRTKGGANGGALPYNISANIFQQYLIPLRSTTADLTYLQHHVQVAYSQGDPYDSTQFLTASVFYDYYSFQFGEYVPSPDASYYLTNLSRRIGANIRGSENFAFGRLNLGAEAVRNENSYNSHTLIPSENRVSGYADEEFDLFDLVRAGVFGRGDFVSDKFYPAFGFLFGFSDEYFNLEAGGNISDHVPSLSEKYFVTQDFTGNPNLRAETDKLLQVKANVKLGETFEFSLKPYIRFIDNPIYFREVYIGQPTYPNISVVNLNTRKIYGVDATIRLTVWKFGADGNLNYVNEKVDGGNVNTLPKYYAAGELYYHDILFNGHLNFRVGVRGRVLSEFQGSGFYPEALIYYPTDLNQYGPYGSSDLFLQGKIGSAVIYFTFFNLTGEDYFLAPVYPALNSSFAFGINWEFLN